MGVDKFEVTFNKPNRTYFIGDTLTIQIDITSNSGFKLNQISCILLGYANTNWSKRHGNTTYIYKGMQTYFDKRFILFAKSHPHAEPVELPPGEYSYQFSFQIPYGIPPSLNGSFLSTGRIQYKLIAIMDRPWKFDETINSLFFIKSLFDLNKYPTLSEPAGTIIERNLCCCFNSGEILAIVKIPYKGYVVGQDIPITIQIENCSNLHINDIFVYMKRVDKYYTANRTHCKEKSETVKSQIPLGVTIKSGDSYAFCFNYVVPSVPVINMMHCYIIDINYVLKFELKLSGLTYNMKGELPILVGDTPIAISQSPNMPPSYDLIEIGNRT